MIATIFLVWDRALNKKEQVSEPVFHLYKENTTQQVVGDKQMISLRLLLVLVLGQWLVTSHAIRTFTASQGLHLDDLAFTLADSIYIDVDQPIQAIRVGIMAAHAWPQDLEGINTEI